MTYRGPTKGWETQALRRAMRLCTVLDYLVVMKCQQTLVLKARQSKWVDVKACFTFKCHFRKYASDEASELETVPGKAGC